MAERGFFAKELNVGWREWQEAGLPTHSGHAAVDSIECECSKGLAQREAAAEDG